MQVSQPPTSKRILYVVTKATWGGAQRYVFDLALAAKAAGHEVTVAYGAEGRLAEALRSSGIRGITVGNLGRDLSVSTDTAAFRDLYRVINAVGPDVVHLNSSKAGALGALAGRMLGIKRIIFTAHGWAFNEDRSALQRMYFWLAHYATVLLAHQTITVSEATLRDTRGMPFVARKVRLVRLGIEEPDFMERGLAREQLSARMARPLPENVLWLGALSELTWNKSLHTLLGAAASLKERGVHAGVVILGDGEERAFLQTLIEERNLEEEVRLVGFVPDGSRYAKAFDIFVLPSRTEALGYALIEAGYAGLPVVASNVGGIPEVVESGMTGLLVPRENSGALADALELLIKNAARRSQLGAALQKSVQQKFALERMVKETLALY